MFDKTISLLLLLFSTASFAGPNCDWKPVKTETTKANFFTLEVITLDCNIDYFKNNAITTQEGAIVDANNNVVFDRIGNWGPNKEYYPDEISVVDTPDGFPYGVILTSVYGASNISHTYHIYSNSPVVKKIGKVTQPVNRYQTTKGNGSEREVTGFYKDKGVFLIDRMTTEGTELGRCNACQSWNVETLALGNHKLIPFNLRQYSLNNYKPFEINKHLAKGLLLHSQDKRQEAVKAFTKASDEGVVFADVWLARMEMSDIDLTQSLDVIKAQHRELLPRLEKIQKEAKHPSMIKLANENIKAIQEMLLTQ